MKRTLTAPQAPRQYVMLLEEGESVSEGLRSHLEPYDTLIIRDYPRSFFGVDGADFPQSMACEVRGSRGKPEPFVVYENGEVSRGSGRR